MSTAKSRARHFWPQITQPAGDPTASSQDALAAAWRWLLSEFKQLREHRPEEDVDDARWHAAAQIGNLAAALPKYRSRDLKPNKRSDP